MTAGQGAGAHRKGEWHGVDYSSPSIKVLKETAIGIKINEHEIPTYPWEETLNHFGYIYITVNNITGMLYLGLQWSNKNKRKSYLGSGKYIKEAIKKYGNRNFTKYIIDFANDTISGEKLETYYISEYFGYNLAYDSGWYNVNSGTQHGGNYWAGLSKEDYALFQKKISKGNIGKKRSTEIVKEMSKVTSDRFKNSKEHIKTSEDTRKGMNTREVSEKLLQDVELPIIVEGKEYWNFSTLAREYNVPNATVNQRYRAGFRDLDLVKYTTDNHDKSRWGHLFSTENRMKDAEGYAKMYIVYTAGIRYVFISSSVDRLARLISKFTSTSIGKNTLREILRGKRKSYNDIYASQCSFISDSNRLLYACAYLNGSDGVLLYREELDEC